MQGDTCQVSTSQALNMRHVTDTPLTRYHCPHNRTSMTSTRPLFASHCLQGGSWVLAHEMTPGPRRGGMAGRRAETTNMGGRQHTPDHTPSAGWGAWHRTMTTGTRAQEMVNISWAIHKFSFFLQFLYLTETVSGPNDAPRTSSPTEQVLVGWMMGGTTMGRGEGDNIGRDRR